MRSISSLDYASEASTDLDAGVNFQDSSCQPTARNYCTVSEELVSRFFGTGRTNTRQDLNKKLPALMRTRNSVIACLYTVAVAPVTSTIRGVPSRRTQEVVLNEEDA